MSVDIPVFSFQWYMLQLVTPRQQGPRADGWGELTKAITCVNVSVCTERVADTVRVSIETIGDFLFRQ